MVNKKMKIARNRVGITQLELGKRIGCTRQTINLIEAGRYNPSLKIIKGIMRELERSFEDLFGTY